MPSSDYWLALSQEVKDGAYHVQTRLLENEKTAQQKNGQVTMRHCTQVSKRGWPQEVKPTNGHGQKRTNESRNKRFNRLALLHTNEPGRKRDEANTAQPSNSDGPFYE